MGGREYLSQIRRNIETGQVEMSDYLAMDQAVREYVASSPKNMGLDFIEMGPDNIGGRIRTVVLDPNNPNIVWTGGVSGGVWRSTNGANNWSKVASFGESMIVSSIAILGNGHVFVATGNTFEGPGGSGGSGFVGNGLYRSTDNGASWERIVGPAQPWTVSNAWAIIDKLEADPNDPNKLWIAYNGGTGQSGLRWHISGTTEFNTPSGVPNAGCRALEVSRDGQVLVATFGNSQAYISTDFGASFSSIPQGSGTNQLPSTNIGRLEWAISPDDNNFIYAMAATNNGAMNGVFASSDRGSSWARIWPPNFGNNAVPELDLFRENRQGIYDNVLAVRPGSPNTVWAGGVELWQVTLQGQPIQLALPFNFPGCFTCVHADVHDITWSPDGQTVYIGTDGGIYKNVGQSNIFVDANAGLAITQFYDIAFDAKGRVAGGTQDNGTLYLPLEGMPSEQNAYSLRGGDGFDTEISQFDPEVMFATLYYGDVMRTNDGGVNFSYFYDSRLLAQQGQVQFGIGISTDFFTDIALHENANDLNSQDSVTYVNTTGEPIEFGQEIRFRGGIASVEQRRVYTGPALMPGDSIRLQDRVTSLFALGLNGNNGIWVTRQATNFTDSVQWWKVMSNIGGTVASLQFSRDGNHLFIGTNDGRVVRISGFHGAWSFDQADVSGSEYANTLTVSTILNQNAPVTGLGADANDPDRLLVTMAGYGGTAKVRLTTNATAPSPSFTNIWNVPAALNGMPVYDGIIHVEDPDIMVIGTEFGVMATNNGGQTWDFQYNGIPKVPVFTVIQQQWNWQNNPFGPDYVTNPGVIYAGTHGRGIFRSENLLSVRPPQGLAPTAAVRGLNIFPNPAFDQSTLYFELGDRADVNVRIYDMNGRMVQEVARRPLSAGEQRILLNAAALNVGTYIVELIAGNERQTGRMVVTR